MAAVWAAPISPPSLKLAILALADWCNDTGGSLHPSMNSIAAKVGVSKSQAQRLVHAAMSDGYLSVIANGNGGAPGATPHYQLHLDRLPGVVHTDRIHATGGADATGSTDAADGSHQCGEGVAPMRQTGSTHATQTTKNHQRTINEPSKPRVRALGIELPDFIDKQRFAAFVEMRAANRKKLTVEAKRLLLLQLVRLQQEGHDPNAALDEATLGGWSKVYAPKSQPSVKATFEGRNYQEGISKA